jgi:flagellar biosynthetic protein FliP
MLTSFTRIVIVLHFVRQAIGTQTSPPNQILIGMALFLTIFIMQPVFQQINEEAIQPLDAGEITQEEALERGMEPLREFMFGETQAKDINLFLEITGNEEAASLEDIPTSTLIPAFILSELRTAFIIGFLIYIPFIIIDMVVASVLMSMGMMMLPPTTISMPFKILLFVLADGWDLVIGNLVKTFY